ncbi:MAG TPA: hypothetical protein VM511_06870, partial [Luteolibacter sp.]|nr:hypothetical protein [Luteolibacter sp.]
MKKSVSFIFFGVVIAAFVDAAPVEVVVKTTSVIRNDIGPQTFGAGVEFSSVQFRWLMDTGSHADGPSTPARNAIKDLNLGLMRFPSGDS